MAVSTPAGGDALVSGNLGGIRADLEKKAALVRGLPGAQVLHLDRVARDAFLVIVHLDFDEMPSSDLRAGGQAPDHGEVAQAELAHDTRDDDEREQHAEEQIQEVIA